MPPDTQSVGSLSERPFAHLLLWVHQTSFSGVLVLARDEVKKSFVFEKGKLVAARSNLPGEILGAMLMEEGKIAPEALQKSVEQLKGKPALRQGELLIQMGLIDHALLNETLEKQLLRRVHEVFTWPDGRFGFVSKIPEDTARIDLGKLLPEICYRGLVRKYQGSKELSDLAESAAPNFVGGQGWSVEALRLVGRELGVWRAIDGVATVAKIVERSKLELPAVRAMLLALRDMGLVRLAASDKLVIEEGHGPSRVSAAAPKKDAEGETAAYREVMALLLELRNRNYYEILGVNRQANTLEIKNAYFALAKRYHPDRIAVPPGSPERKNVEDLFAKISEAHNVLINDASRREYDASLDLKASGATAGEDASKVLESEIVFQKGGILLRKGDFAGAIAMLKEAIALYDKEPEYELLLGWALYRNAAKSKDVAGIKAAKAVLDKAMARNDQMAQGYFFQGLIAKAEGDLERAKRQFEKTVSLDRKHNEAASELRYLSLREPKETTASRLKGLFKKKDD